MTLILALLSLAWIPGCGGGGGSSGGGAAPSPVTTVEPAFTRMPTAGLDPVQIDVTVMTDGQPATGLASTVLVSATAGSLGPITEPSPGVYRVLLTPSRTGEHPVTVTVNGVSVTRTPLILEDVAAGWGQPMAVPGLVNTEGYEDGVTVTPDGEYVFVQYGAIYFSGVLLFSTPRAQGGAGGDRLSPTRFSHPWLDDVIGPITGPERPNFFSGRFSGGQHLHNANSYNIGVDQVSLLAISNAFYGFKRQPDGSYAEPFRVAFSDENDGILGPYGLSFQLLGNNRARIIFAYDDPTDPDMVDFDNDGNDDAQSLTDIYTAELELGRDFNLGTYVAAGPPGATPLRSTPFNSTLVDFGKTGLEGLAGTQGNPHLHAPGGVIRAIFTDDERDALSDPDRNEISVHVLTSGTFPAGTWQKVILPSPVNLPNDSEERQPFFTGTELFFTRGTNTQLPEVWVSSYSGTDTAADYASSANWGTPVRIMQINAPTMTGEMSVVGEPTVATINGKEVLFFVYGVIRDQDAATGLFDLNLQAGFLPRN